MPTQRIAIVYDWLDKWGGVERLLLSLHEHYPHADFYTAHYDSSTAKWAQGLKIKTSFMQRLPSFVVKNRLLSLFFYPYAFESFDFNQYNLVISVTSAFAKAVVTKPTTRHICILLTPTRYLWVQPENYLKTFFLRTVGAVIGERLRVWDYLAARRPDKLLAISKTVIQRCRKYYGLSAHLLYPPFDNISWQRTMTHMSTMGEKLKKKYGSFFLVVARLESYKRIDLVISAFSKTPDKILVIVGKGTQAKALGAKATSNIVFIDYVTQSDLGSLYSHAEALIMPQEEDFGYVALESQYFGCPVIAYKSGGVLETVLEDKSGVFFTEQSISSLTQALARFHTISYNLRHWLKEHKNQHLRIFEKENFFVNLDREVSQLEK